MKKRSTRWTASVLGAVGMLVAVAGGAAPAGAATAPGVSATQITIGFISSTVGVAGPEFVNYAKGAQARFDQQNAAGGVHGRKISMIALDDGGSPTQDLTVAQTLVSKGVFAIIPGTPFFFEAYKYVEQQGIPVVGGGFDGPEWGQQPNTNMFSTTGDSGPNYLSNTLNTGEVLFMKKLGATNVAALGYSVSPSSSAAAEATEKAATHVGMKAAYLNTDVPFGAVNVEPYVLEMKAAKVNAVALEMDNNTNFAVLTAAKQSGLKLKAAVSATGYGQSLLDDTSALSAAQGAYFAEYGPPLNSAPEKAFRAALKKYEGFGGVPGFDWFEGYTQADLMVKGLELAGRNPTRGSFMAGLHNLKGYTAGGLFAAPIDLSLKDFGKPASKTCGWYATVKGRGFVTVPASGKPVCGVRFSE